MSGYPRLKRLVHGSSYHLGASSKLSSKRILGTALHFPSRNLKRKGKVILSVSAIRN